METPSKKTSLTSALDIKKQRDKREAGEQVQLRTMTVQMRKPDVFQLIKSGYVPGYLVNAMVASQSGQTAKDDKEFKQQLEAIELLIKAAFIKPKVVDEPDYDKDEISVDDLTDDDRSDAVTFIMGGAEALKFFRNKQKTPIA